MAPPSCCSLILLIYSELFFFISTISSSILSFSFLILSKSAFSLEDYLSNYRLYFSFSSLISFYLRYAYLTASLLVFSTALSNSLLAFSAFCLSVLIYFSKAFTLSCIFLFSSTKPLVKLGFLESSSLALDSLLSKSV